MRREKGINVSYVGIMGPGTVVSVWTVIELGPFSLWGGYYFGLQMN